MAKSKSTPKDTPSEAPVPIPADYAVVARRYRPQQFADLIGQEPVSAALSNAITSNRIAHAYLFTGARGVGKTSCARIFAKALNCVKGPTVTPCDQCDSCLGIAMGQDADVPEIDGASNNGVDNARELRNNTGFRPTRSRFKIYIIDEVHMLSTQAFNALLKTMEEPPPHVKFILATTEVHKIPITILSRCQRFDFAHINQQRIADTLKHIVKKEGLQADDAALHWIARRAAGSMRDAQSLLEQLLAFATGPLTAELITSLMGTAGEERVADLVQAVLAKDASKALAAVADAADKGLQLGELLDQLVDYWRGLMVAKATNGDTSLISNTEAVKKAIQEQVSTLALDTILAGLDVLTTAKTRIRTSPHAQIHVEMAVVRLAMLDDLLNVAGLAKQMTNGPAQPSVPVKKNPLTANGAVTPTTTPPASAADTGPLVVTSQTLPTVWDKVLARVGPMRASNLRVAGTPAILGPNALALRFPESYSQAYDLCSAESTLEQIRQSLKDLTGQDWGLRAEKVADPVGGVTLPASQAASGGVGAGAAIRQKDLLQLPLFQRIAEKLGGQLVRVEDGFNPHAVLVKETVPVVVPDIDEDAVPPSEDDEV